MVCMEECVEVCRDVQKGVEVHRYAEESRDVQRCAEMCRGVQRYMEGHRGAWQGVQMSRDVH